VKFLCEQCKAKYQIADDKVVGKTVRMKCRKCGHLIEVRAAITESSVASVPPAAPAGGLASGQPKPAQRPAPPRSTPLAASLAARPAAPKPERLPSGLANTFKTSVQREDEVSAPFDMSELSPGDDWYVAVNGVPVGPIRVAEVRRKASLGAVTEDSLVWQEGLDEWRPLRSFPELAAIVREAASTGRASMTPPPAEVRPGSSLSPPARSVSLRPSVPLGSPSVNPRVSSMRVGAPAATPLAAPLVAPAARSNVVPITSRLATAERLDESVPNPFAPRAAPVAHPIEKPVLRAPEAITFVPPAPSGGPTSAAGVVVPERPTLSSTPPRSSSRKGPPWIVFGMIGMFIAFGVTAAILVVPAWTQTPAPAASATPPASAVPAPIAAASAPAAPTVDLAAVAPTATATATATAPRGQAGGGVRVASTATPPPSTTSTGKAIDLSGLTGGPRVAPTDEVSADSNRGPGQCLTEGQVSQTISQHSIALRRSCWERNPSAKGSANVTVSLTVGGDGSAQNVSSNGDDLSVAHCIENDVKNWHFPAMGCSQKIAVPFKFVRQ
jgi:predicted Zn finger-like uncharacterized protein